MQDDSHTDSHTERSHDAATKPASGERKYWLDDSRNIRKIYSGLWIFSAVLVTADLFYEKHVEFPIERLVGFFGLYGFVSCVLLVLAAKQLRKIVGRDENYYDR